MKKKLKLVSLITLLICLTLFFSGCTQQIPEGQTSATEPIQKTSVVEPQIEEQDGEEAETPEAILPETSGEPVSEEPSLIAYWKFDGDAKEAVKGHEGTVIGGAVFAEGKLGGAINFDGIDDFVKLPQEALNEVEDLEEGTIAFWFKFEGSLLETQTVMPIFYLGVEDKAIDNIFIIEIGHFDEESFAAVPVPDPDNKKLYVTWIRNNREPFLCYDSRVNLEENKWHHFAVVVSEEGNIGYLNGIEMTDRHYNFGKANDNYFLDDIPNKTEFMFGKGRSSYMLSPEFVYFKGALDELRIYNRALSSAEIESLFER